MTPEEIEIVARKALEKCIEAMEDLPWSQRDEYIKEAIASAQAAITALDQYREGKEPVAWLHTLHMEGGQTSCRVTFEEDDAFGEPGRDYSPEYEVTSEPLFK